MSQTVTALIPAAVAWLATVRKVIRRHRTEFKYERGVQLRRLSEKFRRDFRHFGIVRGLVRTRTQRGWSRWHSPRRRN